MCFGLLIVETLQCLYCLQTKYSLKNHLRFVIEIDFYSRASRNIGLGIEIGDWVDAQPPQNDFGEYETPFPTPFVY